MNNIFKLSVIFGIIVQAFFVIAQDKMLTIADIS